MRRLPADGDDESCLVMHDVEGNEFCLDWVAANVNMPSDPRHHRSTSPDRAEVLMVVGIDGVQPQATAPARVVDSPPSATPVETFAIAAWEAQRGDQQR